MVTFDSLMQEFRFLLCVHCHVLFTSGRSVFSGVHRQESGPPLVVWVHCLRRRR